MMVIWHYGLARAMVAALLAFLLTGVALATLRPLAVYAGLIDRPAGRKAHAAPTPAFGGLAIAIGVAPFVLYLLPLSAQLRGFAVAALIILVAGAADDRWRLRWRYRITAQVAAALAMSILGDIRIDHLGAVFGFQNHTLGVFSTPLTVIATVGIINAVNMADGVDGLAGSVSLVTLSLLAAAAVYAGNLPLAKGLVLLVGALCAFLLFNLRSPWNPRAKLFLGNAGSELLGLVIACATFRLTQNGQHPVGPQLAPFLVAPVLIDCLALIACRIRRGGSPFEADRNHLHHLMLDAGYSVTAAVLLISGATLAIGAAAALALKAHVAAPVFTLVFLSLVLGHFLWTVDRARAVARLAKLREVIGPLPSPVTAQVVNALARQSQAAAFDLELRRVRIAAIDYIEFSEADLGPIILRQAPRTDDSRMHV